MLAYENHFGERTKNKGMESWTCLFRSAFYGLVKEYLEYHAMASLVRSNVSQKAQLVKYLAVLRKALIKRELTRLEPGWT